MSRKLTILVVDDSRSVQSRQEMLLSEFDAVSVVGSAGDGAEAMQMVAERKPDLVLMDIVMPGMDGLAALRLMRARFPDLRVAMVSSTGGSESRANEAFRLGAVQVLCKPVDRDQLEGLIAQELARLAREGGE